MQNVGIVRGGEGIRDAGQQVYDLMRLALLPGRPVAEGTCFDEFGDQVLAAFKLPRIVDRNDVRMVQRRGHLGFALEPAQARRIRYGPGKELNRDFASEPGVESA